MAEALFSLCGSGKAHHPCRGTFPGLRRRSAHAADGGGFLPNPDFLLCESRIPFRFFFAGGPGNRFFRAVSRESAFLRHHLSACREGGAQALSLSASCLSGDFFGIVEDLYGVFRAAGDDLPSCFVVDINALLSLNGNGAGCVSHERSRLRKQYAAAMVGIYEIFLLNGCCNHHSLPTILQSFFHFNLIQVICQYSKLG